MKNPFKSKDGEKQSLIRLAVIAGRTSMTLSVTAVVACALTHREPRNPEAFNWFAIGGFILWLAGVVAARRSELKTGTLVIKPWINWTNVPVMSIPGIIILVLLIGVMFAILFPVLKPVIYLYPEQQEEVLVQLDYVGKITADYPAMDPALGGWKVTAYPDGHLVDTRDGREYSYLFWEGDGRADWDWSTGFVVMGSDTRQFLQDTLPKLGLTPKEYNEFIVYWYPKMQGNAYNLIHFAGREYTDTAPLTITPTPDTVIRVFMVWKPLAVPISLPEQPLPPVVRKGFTVVEWGGAEER